MKLTANELHIIMQCAARYRYLLDNRVGSATHMGAVLYTPELVVPRGMSVAEISAAIDSKIM